MAVSPSNISESHTGTSGSVSEDSFSWTHTAALNTRGALVFVFSEGSSGNNVIGVTYDGEAMTAVPGGRAVDTGGENGDCQAWFLGRGTGSGSKTVVVTRTNNTDQMYAVCATVVAGTVLTAVTGVVLLQENQTLAEQNVDDGTPGTNSVRYAGCYSGDPAIAPAGVNSTALHSIDLGARGFSVVRETTAGQGSRPVGFLNVLSDDVAAVHLAIKEDAQSPVPRAMASYRQRRI